ncbi:MAG: hypothetical protein HY719_00920 [Planctomycetes bacterium]|nr:hypothetical protein [Planctomycetota bacterium]
MVVRFIEATDAFWLSRERRLGPPGSAAAMMAFCRSDAMLSPVRAAVRRWDATRQAEG